MQHTTTRGLSLIGSFSYSWMYRCADVDLHVIRSKSGNWRERYFDGDFCMGHDGPDSITDNR